MIQHPLPLLVPGFVLTQIWHVLGLREGATENATVVRELLEDPAQRGVDFTRVRLYVLDGAKALHAAVKKVAGASALIQRCQLHKKRNVRDHLPKQYQASVWRQMSAAYGMRDYAIVGYHQHYRISFFWRGGSLQARAIRSE